MIPESPELSRLIGKWRTNNIYYEATRDTFYVILDGGGVNKEEPNTWQVLVFAYLLLPGLSISP